MENISRSEKRLRKLAEKRQAERNNAEYYSAGQWKLMLRRFSKNKLAIIGVIILISVYFVAIFCEFISPYDPNRIDAGVKNQQPQTVRYRDDNGFSFKPFIHPLIVGYDEETMQTVYTEDTTRRVYVKMFVKGDEYKMWGFIPGNIHLFGLEEGAESKLLLFGSDSMGRCLFSRICYGARISCSIGIVGVLLSFLLGIAIGGLSAYFGGRFDAFVQRTIDFIVCLPTLPIWMALSAAIPPDWPVVRTYFCMVLILSLMGWPGLARVVRSKFISLSNEDYIRAAKTSGSKMGAIIFRHMIPSFASYLIAQLTLSIPGQILGETAMSFLGLGLRSPAISWGILLKDAQSIRNIALYPWLLIPGIFVALTIMAFNFLGDGLRDAADPYS